MSYLSLREIKSGTVREFETTEVRLGRDPECEWQVSGEGADVVSSHHARFMFHDGMWWVEDVGSSNGTSLNDKHVSHGQQQPVTRGAIVGLGDRGPRFRVEATEKRLVAKTVIEHRPAARPSAPTMPLQAVDDRTLPMAALDAEKTLADPIRAASRPAPATPAPPAAPPPPKPNVLSIVVHDARTDVRFEAKGGRIRVGRGDECELRPVDSGDTSVSRVHAEIVLMPDGRAVVRDAKSRNGTFANGHLIVGDHPLKQGDRIMLGEGGPDLVVDKLILPGAKPEPVAKHAPEPVGPARRSFAGKGKTVFFREMMEETTKKSANRLRWVVWSFVLLLAGTVGVFYWWSQQQERTTTAALEAQRQAMAVQQAQSDSVRRAAGAEYDRLRQALDSARSSAASPAVVESLRQAFSIASKRTEALEGALKRAQSQVAQQLAAGDSARKVAQAELGRVRAELNRASSAGGASSAEMDSLRAAFKEAQQRAAAVEAQVRAVKEVNLPAIAEANGPAIGMVWSYNPDEEGSGFMLTQSGYFVTNRHVVMDAQGKRADSATIIMAEQRIETARKVDIVAVAPMDGPDLALLRVRGYKGPYVHHIDWTQAHARQGDRMATIGFPSGSKYAFKESLIPRTTMSSGMLSKVTPELIQWEGLSLPGSSGSPVFNGDGEIVGVHRASSEGIKFAVPIPQLIQFLPAEVKKELGLP